MFLNKACSLPGEAALLHRSIADFSVDGPRADYAAWLAAQGDESRSKDVLRTIEAFQRMDSASLEEMGGSGDWHDMIAVPLLLSFIQGAAEFDKKEMTRFRDVVFSKLRPALSLSYTLGDAVPELGTSRLWGLPDLPKTELWPKIKMASNWYDSKDDLPGESHCAFIGQFAFADFSGTVLGQELPHTGGFSVFTITEAAELGITETLFRPWDNQEELVRGAAPLDLLEDKLGDSCNVPNAVHDIILKEILSLPDATDGPFTKVIPHCSWGEPYNDFYYSLRESCGDTHLGFGGYLSGTSGGDPSPDIDSARMAVLRVTPDAGVVHFAIPAKDLPLGKLDDVKYVWNDWDG